MIKKIKKYTAEEWLAKHRQAEENLRKLVEKWNKEYELGREVYSSYKMFSYRG